MDTGDTVEDVVLRQKGRVVDMMTGISSTQAERTARITSAQSIRDNKIAAARAEALAAAREDLGEDDEPIPDNISNDDLGIDFDALELSDVPTERQLRGTATSLPIDTDANRVELYEDHVEPRHVVSMNFPGAQSFT